MASRITFYFYHLWRHLREQILRRRQLVLYLDLEWFRLSPLGIIIDQSCRFELFRFTFSLDQSYELFGVSLYFKIVMNYSQNLTYLTIELVSYTIDLRYQHRPFH